MRKAHKNSHHRAPSTILLVIASMTFSVPATHASIIGGDANSIIGGDTNSIIGGDLNSIIGGDTNSIIGGDLNSIIGGDYSALGPIERVDLASKTIVVFGQTFRITAKTSFALGKSLRGLKALRVGDYVSVEGHRNVATSGGVADSVLRLSHAYVSGSSPTFVRGYVSAISASTGVVAIGALQVDITTLLANQFDFASLAVGDQVYLAGTQPAPNGVMLANSGELLLSQSIIGGDANSIIGGDANSIIGGDANSIIGGDANSIIGGDANSIIGGDANSIIGGDANSIIGGDTNSIIGGDRLSR